VFGVPGAPDNFDPTFAQDDETFRPARQMYETLVSHEPGNAKLALGLALSWTPNADFTEWTFELREGVKFHDGTAFDGAAVCFNFDRWVNLPNAAAQAQAVYYSDTFEGFANNQGGGTGDPVYNSCSAPDPAAAVIKLNKAKGAFPAAFALTALSISSPAALKQYDADRIEQGGRRSRTAVTRLSTPPARGPSGSRATTARRTPPWCVTTTTGVRRRS
jgi:peptide/nickel transport system substrate-binding protein